MMTMIRGVLPSRGASERRRLAGWPGAVPAPTARRRDAAGPAAGTAALRRPGGSARSTLLERRDERCFRRGLLQCRQPVEVLDEPGKEGLGVGIFRRDPLEPVDRRGLAQVERRVGGHELREYVRDDEGHRLFLLET